jgi:hypothetical protein
MVALSVLAAGNAVAAEYWWTPEQVAKYQEKLRQESTERVALSVFHPIGFLLGLSGHFPLADGSPSTVQAWLEEHKAMLGVGPHEALLFTGGEEFREPIASGDDDVSEATVGGVYRFAVRIAELPTEARTIQVIVDKRFGWILRGLVNSYHPTMSDFVFPNVLFSESDAWKVLESYHLGYSVAVKRTAQRAWTSPAWIESQTPGKKEYVWVLSAELPNGSIRSYVVSPQSASIVHETGGKTWFSPRSQEHMAYEWPLGDVYWQSTSPSSGCNTTSTTCTDPAFGDSVSLRTTGPYLLESWKNISGPSWGPFFWPWSSAGQSIRSPMNSASDADHRNLTFVLANGAASQGRLPAQVTRQSGSGQALLGPTC